MNDPKITCTKYGYQITDDVDSIHKPSLEEAIAAWEQTHGNFRFTGVEIAKVKRRDRAMPPAHRTAATGDAPSQAYAKFLEYHRLNPGVYTFMCEIAREVLEAGYTRYGFPMIFNQCRWHFGVKQRNTEFELNNNLLPFYSRLLMQNEPDLAGFFETRKSKADLFYPEPEKKAVEKPMSAPMKGTLDTEEDFDDLE